MARRAAPFCRWGLEGFAAPLYRCGFGHLGGKAGHRRRGVAPLRERLRIPHHLGAPGTLRQMCAYLPAPLRPPEGESVNPPTFSPLADLAHHLVQAAVLLDRLPTTLRDRLAEGVGSVFVSAVLASPGRQRLLPGHRNHSHLPAPGPQPPPQVEVRLRSLFPTRFQSVQPNRFPHWISRARVQEKYWEPVAFSQHNSLYRLDLYRFPLFLP